MKKRAAFTVEQVHSLLFDQHLTIKEASLKLGVHRSTLDKALVDYKIRYPDLFPERKPIPRLRDRLPIEELKELWGKLPTNEIARRHHVTPQYLYALVGEYRQIRPEWFPKPRELSVFDLEGKTIGQIHRDTGRSKAYVKRRRKELGLTRRPISDFLDRYSLQSLFDEGIGVSQIANEYDVTYQAVYTLARKYDLAIPRVPKAPYRRFTSEERTYIAAAKAEGQSIVRIAQTLGRTAKSIQNQFAFLERRQNYVKVHIPEEDLEWDYVICGKTPEEIAEQRSVTLVDVKINIERYGLKL